MSCVRRIAFTPSWSGVWQGDQARIIGSIVNFLFAPDDPQKVIEQMASAETRIISLTITEGGYYIDQSTGEFNEKHPDIQHDLRSST